MQSRHVYAILILLVIISIGSASVHEAKIDKRILNEFSKSDHKLGIASLKENKVDVVVKYVNTADEDTKNIIEDYVNTKRRLDYTNGFSAKISKKDLEKLRFSPFIDSINFDPPVYAFLNESNHIVNASFVKNITINGLKINGTGETVCVIDTGIDYTLSNLGGCIGSGCKVMDGYDFVNSDNDPMDDHGHGTHVAGIVASLNDSYPGIVNGARLIAIKVLDSSGSGTFSNINSGLNWCIHNATLFNISVITMSIGTQSPDIYTSYCDDIYPDTSNIINNATLNNISVLISSGNDGSVTSISSPACIFNATSVGSTTKTDAVSSFSNGNNITDLLAPGSLIYSLKPSFGCLAGCSCTGNVMRCSGTSMAAPHVAGAAALIKQFKKLDNSTNLTNNQVQNTLNATGIRVLDSGNGLTFSRINILRAIISLDTTKPTISIFSNNSFFSSTNVSLNYIAADFVQLDQCFFTNTTGTNVSLSSCGNTTFLAAANAISNITFYANDSNGNLNETQLFFTVDTILPYVNISLPMNITYGNVTNYLNFTATDTNLDKIWYRIDNGTNSTITANITFNASEGSHILHLFANDSAGNLNNTNVSFSIDLTPPNVTIQNPSLSLYNTSSLNINYTVSDRDQCKLEWYNETGTAVNFSLVNCENTTLQNMNSGLHRIKIWVNDTVNNTNFVNSSFTIDLVAPNISISLPSGFYTVRNLSLNYTVADQDNCWFYYNETRTNLSSCQNTTFISEGGHRNLTVYVNDSSGNVNFSTILFSVNSIFVDQPENMSYNFNTSLPLNFTISNFNTDKIWYRIGNGANFTITSNTTFNASEGSHLLTLVVNNTLGEINQTNISFSVDITVPNLTVQTQNKTYNISSVNINYTTNAEQCKLEWYNESGNAINISLSCQNTTLSNLISGFHRIILSVNDSSNNINSSELNFTVDIVAPVLNITSPLNASYSATNISINFTTSESDQCWFVLNTNRTNLTSCQNATFIATIGESNFTLYVNDSAGNVNFSLIPLFVDQTNPSINLSSPTATTYSSTSISLNFDVSDNHQVDKCWYKLNSGSNTTIGSCANTTITGSSGSNLLILAVNDTAGNRNETNVTFTVTLPAVSTSSGGGGSSTSTVSTKTKDVFTLTQNTNYVSSLLTAVSRIEVSGYTGNAVLSISTPSSVQNTISNAYSYIEINFTSNITSAKIQFYVNKSWVDINKLDSNKIVLSHYKNSWISLPTIKIAENSTSFTYQAITDSFSLFAISGQEKEIPAVNVTVPTDIKDENNVTEIVNETVEPVIEKKKDDFWPFFLIGAVLVLILAVLIIRHFLQKGAFQQSMNK